MLIRINAACGNCFLFSTGVISGIGGELPLTGVCARLLGIFQFSPKTITNGLQRYSINVALMSITCMSRSHFSVFLFLIMHNVFFFSSFQDRMQIPLKKIQISISLLIFLSILYFCKYFRLNTLSLIVSRITNNKNGSNRTYRTLVNSREQTQ